MTTEAFRTRRAIGLLALALTACGTGSIKSSERTEAGAQGSSEDGGAESPDDAGGSAGEDDAGGDTPTGSDAGSTAGGGGGGGKSDASTTRIPVRMGEVDPNAPANTGLPPVPRLTNVVGKAVGDSVSITFDPVDGASDYRVYELPAAADVSSTSDGHVTVKNAVYRCAGNRQAPEATMDGAEQVPGGAVKTLVDGQTVVGYKRSLAEATLGYVYPEAGDGRVPVYALGERNPGADNGCYFQRWTASRRKQYVTSTATRDALLKQGLRDDGIAFYVPAAASGQTRPVLTSADDGEYGARLYFVDGPEAQFRKNGSSAFNVLTSETKDTLPLMRVHYANACGQSHDELVAGATRFAFARKQGDQFPVTKLHWSGLTKSTTLVIEALDEGCPYPGLIGPKAAPARTDPTYGSMYAAVRTPEQAQADSATHELYINGQFDNTKPKPIARSFLKIGPGAAPELDWSFGFKADDTLGTFSDVAGVAINCAVHNRAQSASVDTSFYCAESDRFGQRMLYGEWWVMYSDLAADTNGKYRITPKTKADMTADSFLYVTMEVDSFTTLRRYPQLLISDRDAPVQNALPQGNTLVLQTFADWPNTYELQVCDHKNWDVNDQCPKFDLYQQYAPNDANKVVALSPNVEIGDQVGLDYSNRYEIYVSTKRAYVFFDGQPYGCADLPSAGVPSGAVTVTYGDVLYHSGVDHLFDFTKRKLQNVSLRHFDNLGFKSHVAAPAWDEGRFPCTKRLK